MAEALLGGGYGERARLVRVNGLDTEWGRDDLTTLAATGPEAILVPKVDRAEDVAEVARLLDAIPGAEATTIWAMMETPTGILNAAEIAQAPRMAGFVLGTNDLAKDLRCRPDPERSALTTSLQLCLLAARAAGIVCIDGVYNAFKDDEGLTRECQQGLAFGFDGKSLIHPAQLDITNQIFAPSEADITLARRQIEAFEAAMAAGQGVAVLDGRIVENLHVATAREILAKSEAITRMGVA